MKTFKDLQFRPDFDRKVAEMLFPNCYSIYISQKGSDYRMALIDYLGRVDNTLDIRFTNVVTPEEITELMEKIQKLPMKDLDEFKTKTQYYNYCILNRIGFNIFLDSEIQLLIEQHPHQRFGQIICNYVCPDYRSDFKHPYTEKFMNMYFNIDMDPFYEESIDTYMRLNECKLI